jgi:hypothetical protein
METTMPEGDTFPDPKQPQEVPPRDPTEEDLPDEEDDDVVDRAQQDLSGKLGAFGSGRSG